MKQVFVILAIFAGAAFAQMKPTLRVDYDYARFAYDDTAGYFELYYSFYEQDFKAMTVETNKFIEGSLGVQIVNLADKSEAVKKEFHFKSPVTPQAEGQAKKSLIGNLGFKLPFGKYNCLLTAADANIKNMTDTVSFIIDMQPYSAERFSLSDLQLASSIGESDNTASTFYKNSYEITPNPSMVFGENLPVIFFYAEIYNTTKSLRSELLRIDHTLLNSANRVVSQKSKYSTRKNNNIVEAGSVNIRKVPTGSYTLRVAVSDTSSKLAVQSSKKLFIYNPGIVDTTKYEDRDADMLASEFIAYSENEVEIAFDQAKYIAKKDELDTWKKLKEADAKKQFLYNFWKTRNAAAGEDDSKTSKQYYLRIRYANERFTTVHRQGWKTDRGRVLLMYGEPNEIERYPNEIDSKPYEIWRYHNLEGGVQFIFGDVSGFSEYQLLHSTMRGEMRDDNWERRIRQM